MPPALQTSFHTSLTTLTVRTALPPGATSDGSAANEEILAVVQRLIKQRREASEQYRAHGVQDRADRELEEARILEGYMPEQLTDAEIEDMAREAVTVANAAGPRDMGKVMGLLMPKVKGRAEGGRVRETVSRLLKEGAR